MEVCFVWTKALYPFGGTMLPLHRHRTPSNDTNPFCKFIRTICSSSAMHLSDLLTIWWIFRDLQFRRRQSKSMWIRGRFCNCIRLWKKAKTDSATTANHYHSLHVCMHQIIWKVLWQPSRATNRRTICVRVLLQFVCNGTLNSEWRARWNARATKRHQCIEQ